MRQLSRPPLLLALLTGLCLTAALRAAPPAQDNPEIKFANELERRHYPLLAADQLMRTRGRESLPVEVRDEATKALARVYATLGDDAERKRDFSAKTDYYKKAVTECANYLKATETRISKEAKAYVQFEEGRLCAALARDDLTGMETMADQKEREDYKKSAIEWLSRAEKDLAASAEVLVPLRDALEKTVQTAEQRTHYREVREQAGRVTLERGKALYSFSQVYTGKDETKDREAKLTAAIELFQKLAADYSMFDVSYTAQRYVGLCYRGLGKYEQAVEAIKKALNVQQMSDTAGITRPARYNLVQTLCDWGKYDEAVASADALINELNDAVEASGGTQEEIDLLLAAQIEKCRTLIGRAKMLMARAAQYAKEGKKALEADDRTLARRDYQYAVNEVHRMAGDQRSRWARNAKAYMDAWMGESAKILGSPIKFEPDATTYMAEGMRLFGEAGAAPAPGAAPEPPQAKAKKYLDAIRAFGKAISMADVPLYRNTTLIPEAWYKMGEAYYNLSRPEFTGGKYNNYYEAALCFSQIPDAYPKVKFAPDAAYASQQLFGAIFEHSRKNDLKDALPYDGRRYYQALDLFSRRFPTDPRAEEAVFQSAEIARTIGQFEGASALYAQVKRDSQHFYEARYLGGFSLYLEALKLFEDVKPAPTTTIDALLNRALESYKAYAAWFDDNAARLGPEQLNQATRWVVTTKIGYGKLLIHDVWALSHDKAQGARQAIEVLKDMEKSHFSAPAAQKIRDELLPEAFFVTIQAYREMGELGKAESFVNDVAKQYPRHKLSSQAAGLLGYAYLQRRNELEAKKGPQPEIDDAVKKSGQFLQMALDLNPDQNLRVYVDVGTQLLLMREYTQAVKIVKAGLERFPIKQDKPDELQAAALDRIERAYRNLADEKAENWASVEQYAKQLAAIQPRNLDYLMDAGLALEKQSKFKDAIPFWRSAKASAGTARQEEFNTSLHLSRCYAKSGQADYGFKIIGWVLLADTGWLQNTDRAKRLEETFDEVFKNYWPQVGGYAFQILNADINLLRKPDGLKIAQGLCDRHFPDRKDELQKLMKKAQVELRVE